MLVEKIILDPLFANIYAIALSATMNFLGANYFVFKNTKQIVDDHYYVNTITGIPTIDIIEYDPSTVNNFNKHWHTHKDDMNNIDKNTLNAVGQTLLDIIYQE